jgi:type IV pilus assembly protein PilE
MMIVVAVVAILSAIAIPAYQNYLKESRRASAKTALLDIASREEKYFSINNVYAQSLSSLGYSTIVNGAIQVPNASNDYYNVNVPAAASTAFSATATPENAQASDVCGSFTLNNYGVQNTSSGNVSNNGKPCW